ncbi:hypothetical protein [Mycoplasma amphoriforme]|uniref:hypothetical protein n=1 Tax=Mycoplasma amphoriforme TaxID=273136 RepID=UPI0031BB04EB
MQKVLINKIKELFGEFKTDDLVTTVVNNSEKNKQNYYLGISKCDTVNSYIVKRWQTNFDKSFAEPSIISTWYFRNSW